MSELDPLPGSAWQGPPPVDPPAVAVAVEDEPPRYPFWTWGDLVVFLTLLICAMAGLMFITGLIVAATQVPKDRLVLYVLPVQFIAVAVALAGLKLMFHTRYHRPFWRSLAWNFDFWALVPMFVAGFLLAIGVATVAQVLGARPGNSPMEQLLRETNTALLVAALSVTVGPICEELLFRGLLQPLTIQLAGVAGGIVLAALPFALLHWQQYAGSWQHVLAVFLAGAVFGYVRHRSGSTATAAIMHA
ncbi:MAG TPA: type II CAAX endopeptidase family protein, partial [Bryobacteraceae bacterium]|nr:type II CAAX endopeptidase family protein [Bryobacteraceae bacterium]